MADKQITTIEGLEKDGQLHPLQDAFLKADALQCGYCTSGMIIAGVALLDKNPKPTREDIVSHMNGNICRCGTYLRIIAAIQMAAEQKECAMTDTIEVERYELFEDHQYQFNFDRRQFMKVFGGGIAR